MRQRRRLRRRDGLMCVMHTLFFIHLCSLWKADNNSSAFHRQNATRKGLPFHRQDQICLRICTKFIERRCETNQIHTVFVVEPIFQSNPSDNTICVDQPPRRDLKVSDLKVKNLTLAELELAPSSVLLLRFEDESLNGTLNPDVLLRIVI